MVPRDGIKQHTSPHRRSLGLVARTKKIKLVTMRTVDLGCRHRDDCRYRASCGNTGRDCICRSLARARTDVLGTFHASVRTDGRKRLGHCTGFDADLDSSAIPDLAVHRSVETRSALLETLRLGVPRHVDVGCDRDVRCVGVVDEAQATVDVVDHSSREYQATSARFSLRPCW